MMAMAVTTQADETTCRETLRKCDLAVHAQQKVIENQTVLIDLQGNKINLLEEQARSNGFWRDIAIGGVVVTVLTIMCFGTGTCHAN